MYLDIYINGNLITGSLKKLFNDQSPIMEP